MALSYEEQGNSFTALRDYMLSGNGNNNGTHNAKVVIEDSESHILFNETIEIFTRIETNDSFVEFFDPIPDNYYQKYSTKYHTFTYNGSELKIDATDKQNNPITIHITSA